MIKHSKYLQRSALSIAIASLAACGGGGSSSDSSITNDDSAVITQKTTASVGVITGFGSVFINGVEFETDDAAFATDDDNNATEDDLEIGMVVSIQGSVNEDGVTGEALSIQYSEDIRGRVEAIDASTGSLVVMGQEVSIEELTVFENVTLATLMIGDVVEVSGLMGGDSILLATRIEKEDGTENLTLKIKAYVENLDTSSQTFTLGHLTIDYSAAEIDEEDTSLADGVLVKVKGSQSATGANLLATEIDVKEHEYDIEEGEELQLEGLIADFESTESFTVNGSNVITNDDTEYKHGVSGLLAADVRVKVKGELNAEQQLVAEKIKFYKESKLEVEGAVEAVDLVEKTVTVLGVTFHLNEHTHMDDEGANDVRYFDIADISVGDIVEIKGFEVAGELIAAKLEREEEEEEEDSDSDENEVELRGFTGTIDIVEYTFTLSGVTIHTSLNTDFEGTDDQIFDQASFFAQLEDDTNIKIEGSIIDGEIHADEVEVKEAKEDEDDDENESDDDESNDEEESEKSEITGIVSGVSDAGFSLLHYSIVISEITEFEGESGPMNSADFLAELQVGDEVEVKGSKVDDIITAIQVELEERAEEEEGEEDNSESDAGTVSEDSTDSTESEDSSEPEGES